MSTRAYLDISELILEIETPTHGIVDFPILGLQISYQIKELPMVSVTISTAPVRTDNRGEMGGLDFEEELDSALGTVAHVKMTVTPKLADTESSSVGNALSDIPIILFSGYVAANQASFAANRVTVKSTRTFRLIAAAEAVDATPLGALSYFGDTVANGNNDFKLDFNTIVTNTQLNEGDLDATYFNIDPIGYLVGWVDTFYQFVDRGLARQRDTYETSQLVDAVYAPPIRPLFEVAESSNLSDWVRNFVATEMSAKGTTATLYSLLQTFLLDWVPETVSVMADTPDQTFPCKMLIRPINAWDDAPHFYITPDMLIEEAGSVEYKINGLVDCWCVSFGNPLQNQDSIYNCMMAVYGPQLGGSKGEPVLTTFDKINELVSKANQKARNAGSSRSAYVTARVIPMPGWLGMTTVVAYKDVPSNGDTGTTQVKVIDNPAGVSSELSTLAGKLAVQAFLSEGREKMQIYAKVPLLIWLQLLSQLGRVGAIDIPDTQLTGDNNVDLSSAVPYYGLLHSMDLRIEVENKNVYCNTSIVMSSVRTEEDQEEYASENVLYTVGENVDDQWEAQKLADTLGAALGISYNPLDNSGLQGAQAQAKEAQQKKATDAQSAAAKAAQQAKDQAAKQSSQQTSAEQAAKESVFNAFTPKSIYSDGKTPAQPIQQTSQEQQAKNDVADVFKPKSKYFN